MSSKKRNMSSTASELDSSRGDVDQPSDQGVFDRDTECDSPEIKDKKKKKPPPKQRKLEEFTMNTGNIEEKGENQQSQKSSSLDRKLDEINQKLKNILTKDDSLFIKQIIRSTLEEIKEQLLSSVIKRVETIEGELHEKCIETEMIKQELQFRDKKISELVEENNNLKAQIKGERSKREKEINDQEQYGRRNNIRINGITKDSEKQASDEVIDLVVKTLNEKGNLNVKADDIDIAHRLGKWKAGDNRAIIVKFVRRQSKIEVMKQRKELRQKKVFVNEDLTWLNQQVLASLRLKDSERINRCWSFEGKLYALFKNDSRPTEIKFKDYETWLSKPWPGAK